MPRAPDDVSAVAADLRRLRLAGRAAEALHLASRSLQTGGQDRAVMGEAIRILICLGEAPAAANLYQTYAAGPQASPELETEVLVRLALLLERRELLADMDPPPGPSWLVTLLTSGHDPAEPLLVRDLQIRIEIGHSVFAFAGSCPHCGHSLAQEFRDTLLVHRTWVCPGCFGLVRLDHVTARRVLRDKYAGQLGGGLQNTDQQLIEHIKPRLTGQATAPFIVQALGQGYHFVLNELVLKYGAGAAEPAPEVAP